MKYIDPWWQGAKEATIATRSGDFFVHGNGKDRPGTDYYTGWIGAVMAWEDAVPYGLVPE